MVHTMHRLLGIITIVVALAFAFGVNAQLAHACPFAGDVEMDHSAPHAMTGHAMAADMTAKPASPAQDHSQLPFPCKHSCPPVTFVIALNPLALPDVSAVTVYKPQADAALSLAPTPSERPPKLLV